MQTMLFATGHNYHQPPVVTRRTQFDIAKKSKHRSDGFNFTEKKVKFVPLKVQLAFSAFLTN